MEELATITYRIQFARVREHLFPHEQKGRYLPFSLVLFVEDGIYACTVGGVRTRVYPHELLVVPSFLLHDIALLEEGHLTWAHISAVEGHQDILHHYSLPLVLKGRIAADVAAQIVPLTEVWEQPSSRRRTFSLQSRISAIYSLLLEQAVHLPTDDDSALRAVYQLILAHPETAFSGEELAERAHMAPSTFYRRFRAQFGVSPNEMQVENRIRSSLAMLLSGVSVKETATRLGFCDEYYFSRLFKQHMGCSPRAYIRVNLTGE